MKVIRYGIIIVIVINFLEKPYHQEIESVLKNNLKISNTFELDSLGRSECRIDRFRKWASGSTYTTEFKVPYKDKINENKLIIVHIIYSTM